MIAVLLELWLEQKQILINTLSTAFSSASYDSAMCFMIPILVGIAYVIPKYQF